MSEISPEKHHVDDRIEFLGPTTVEEAEQNHKSNDFDDIGDDALIVDPLLKYLNCKGKYNGDKNQKSQYFNIEEVIEAIKTEGYYHIPSVLTHEECNEALGNLWDFVEDVSGGCVHKSDPTSWYPRDAIESKKGNPNGSSGRIDENHEDYDPWPHTGYSSFPDMFQSLGAGFVLGKVRELLAGRVFEPLYGTRELICSKEGFTFHRPLVVDLNEGEGGDHANPFIWNRHNGDGSSESFRPLFRVCGKPQPESVGQHYDQGVPLSAMSNNNKENNNGIAPKGTSSNKQGKSKMNKMEYKRIKNQKYKELTGLCHIQASISFTDQTIDKDRGGGHFLCYSNSHSKVHRDLVGGTYRATPSSQVGRAQGDVKERADPTWVPLTDSEVENLKDLGCKEERIHANVGDVILWRSDLVHAGVAPTLVQKSIENGNSSLDGSREFRAVGYCSMLPMDAARDYILWSMPKYKLRKKKNDIGENEMIPLEMASTDQSILQKQSPNVHPLLLTQEEFLTQQKLEAYRTGRTGDHRPEVEVWHDHRRVTMWDQYLSKDGNKYSSGRRFSRDFDPNDIRRVPPRTFQRPKFRLGPPPLTVRQAELYGLLPYCESSPNAEKESEATHAAIKRAVIRGVKFVNGVFNDDKTVEIGASTQKQVNTSADERTRKIIPICLSSMQVLDPGMPIIGQDKYLGGMSSPCGRFIFGVPGHAKRVIRVNVETGLVDWIGPAYEGEFKWLRGVEIPSSVMGENGDGNMNYPSGCCIALPCNSNAGCVLKIDPEKSSVSTFITGPAIPRVEEGWLYHGGNLSSFDGLIYAIPASAPRVMKINPRNDTTEYIGPEFEGKAKWYGGIVGADECIYGIAHNSTGVLKINPMTQEVSVLAEGTLPEGRWKWHGGLASLDRKKIIGFPNNADSILVVDVMKSRVYKVGDNAVLRSGSHRIPQDGRYKYLGGALTADGRYAYLFPCDAEYVLRMDMLTDELKLVGPHLTEGENKFQNGFVAEDGCIYGIPQRSSGVLRIVPPGVKRWDRNGNLLPDDEEHVDVIYCGDDMVSCKDKFEGGVLGKDGSIYCIPLRAKAFLKVIPGPRSAYSDGGF